MPPIVAAVKLDPMVWPPADSEAGLYESVATPLALVVPVPTDTASTVNVTVAPPTAAPPVVRVSVDVSVTVPVEPYVTAAGLGAPRVRVVATLVGATTARGTPGASVVALPFPLHPDEAAEPSAVTLNR